MSPLPRNTAKPSRNKKQTKKKAKQSIPELWRSVKDPAQLQIAERKHPDVGKKQDCSVVYASVSMVRMDRVE